MTDMETRLNKRIDELQKQLAFVISLLQSGLGSVSAKQETSCPYTLHAWLDEWYTVYKAPNVKANTLYTIDVAIRVHIKPNLADMPLNLIQGMDLQKFLTSITKSRTRKTVYDVLNSSFKDALKLKFIQSNPVESVKIPVHKREKGSPLSPKELTTFLNDIKGHALENYFLLLLHTGCRRNEGLSLNKADIDFKNKLLHIRGTKTELSDRTIPLFDNAAALLVKLKHDKDGFYFRFRADYPTHAFKKLCPTHKLHDLRHTFATTCLKAKIPLKVVQIWLGHSEIDTTANIYSHVTKEINQAEAETLNQYLTQKAP